MLGDMSHLLIASLMTDPLQNYSISNPRSL